MKRCILLIEDNESIRENTAEFLDLCGYEMLVATDGNEGFEMIRVKKPDLILCDILMPNMNGYDFLQAVKKDDGLSSIPVIFFTAYSETVDVQKGLQMGAADYIIKPFDPELLVTLIQKYLPI
jgi:CheY-like chemotaxis protein